MKILIIVITLCSSLNLFAYLDQNKISGILEGVHYEARNNNFYYNLVKDHHLWIKEKKKNPNIVNNNYGPYEFVINNLPPGTHFEIYKCNLHQIDNPPLIATGFIDAQNKAWIGDHKHSYPLSEYLQVMGNMLPGEPIYAVLVIDNKDIRAAYVIPRPLEVHGVNGRCLSVEIITLREPLLLFRGKNFLPGEEVNVEVHLEEGIIHRKQVAGADGTFMLINFGKEIYGEDEEEMVCITSIVQNKPLLLTYNWKFLEAKDIKS